MNAEALRVPIAAGPDHPAADVSALLVRPPDAHTLFVLAHGAGADMHHSFMTEVATALGERGVATLRYQFPYTEARSRRIDRQPLLLATVRAAVERARELADGLPIVAGGKSMGGRMTSLASAAAALPDVRALVFLGFPLHPPGKPSTARAEHLAHVAVPSLFVHGTRDELGALELLRPVLPPRAQLHVVEHADHGFAVLVRSGRKPAEVMGEIADAVDRYARALDPLV